MKKYLSLVKCFLFFNFCNLNLTLLLFFPRTQVKMLELQYVLIFCYLCDFKTKYAKKAKNIVSTIDILIRFLDHIFDINYSK